MNMNIKVPLFKQSDGQPSASFSLMMIGFAVITLWLVASIFESLWGINIRQFDPTAAMAYFTPLLTLYFSRRWTDAKHPATSTEIVVVEQPPETEGEK